MEYPLIPIEPDPRISTLRPAWLADDRSWRDQLQALRLDEDIRWIERQWDLADGSPPDHDRSWLKMEYVRG